MAGLTDEGEVYLVCLLLYYPCVSLSRLHPRCDRCVRTTLQDVLTAAYPGALWTSDHLWEARS